MSTRHFYEKIYGCLLSGAIGNAMGNPVENWHYKEIKEKYGKITSLIKPEAMDIEDDIKFVLWLCKTYRKKKGRITPEDWAKVWLEEMDPIEMKWVGPWYVLPDLFLVSGETKICNLMPEIRPISTL